jgi:16S rRNA processing protein RimM
MKRILLARIVGAQGIRGEVRLQSFTGDPAAVADYGPLSDAGRVRSFALKVVRVTPKGVIARIAGIDDRNGAEALRGIDLYVDRAALPPPAPGEYYQEDLVGLAAVTADGVVLGDVIAVQNFGAGDLLEIRMPGRRQTELVPFTDACVPAIDLSAGRAVVVLPLVADDDEDDDQDEEEQVDGEHDDPDAPRSGKP